MPHSPHRLLTTRTNGIMIALFTICLAVLASSYGSNVVAQDNYTQLSDLEISWGLHLASSQHRLPTTIKTTSDNGVLIAGFTGPPGKSNGGQRDSYLIRFDSAHNLLWEKTIEMKGFGQISDFVLDKNDGAILVGEARVEDGYDTGAIVTRIDPQGNILWRKEFGDKWNDGATSIISTADGGAIVAGYSLYNPPNSRSPTSRGTSQLYIVRVDKDGNKIWDTSVESDHENRIRTAQSMAATPDGGAMIIGDVTGSKKFYSIKIDSQGNVAWKKIHVQPEFKSPDDYFKGRLVLVDPAAVVSNPQGGFYVLANRRENLIVMKLDNNGETIWRKTYSGHKETAPMEVAQSMIMTEEGNLIILSFKQISGKTRKEYMKTDTYFHGLTYLLGLDGDGNELWNKTYKYGRSESHGGDLSLSLDGGIYITRGMFINEKEDKSKMRWNIRLMKLMPK